MGTRVVMAICNDCADAKRGIPTEWGEFWFVMEWMSKETLLAHIKNTHCPVCNGDNWDLSDASEI